jgi:hypothetical protein
LAGDATYLGDSGRKNSPQDWTKGTAPCKMDGILQLHVESILNVP